jgi:hypothetical protein
MGGIGLGSSNTVEYDGNSLLQPSREQNRQPGLVSGTNALQINYSNSNYDDDMNNGNRALVG